MSQTIFVILALLAIAAFAAPSPPPPVDPYSKAAYIPVSPINNADFYADYCVVGAGFAGVKAIETLKVDGNVNSWLLIETQHRVGGRVSTVDVGTGANAYPVETHAQWIQGDLRNPILALGAEMSPPLAGGHALWEDYDYYDVDGIKRNSGQGQGTLLASLTRLWGAYACVADELMPLFADGSLPDMSMRDCYSLCGFTPRTAEEYALEAALIAVEWGEISDITSCANTGHWVAYSFYGDDQNTGTANFVTDRRGLSSVAEFILTRRGISLTDSRIHYGVRVTNIDTTKNVIMTTRDGGRSPAKYQCKMLINTMSIGTIQKSLRDETNLITPLPSLNVQASFHKYHMAVFRKIFIQFNTKFWGEKAHFTLTPRDPGLQIVSWTSVDHPKYYPGSKILLASHNGPESNAFINLDDTTLIRRITEELQFIFGPAANFANVTGYYAGHDTYKTDLYGSYSNRPPTLGNAEFRAMWAPVKGHFFPSGEAACDLLNGYVVGAYHIGRTAALRALVNFGVLPESTNAEDNECFRPPAGWHP
jgi:polyamine oxidase